MNTAYPLIPVTLLTFLVYFTTRIFAAWDVFPLNWHRKFWNYLLLFAFLASGLLGILSVIKVNYKLEIDGYEDYLQWHVSVGIALVLIAIFHLSWHLNYYISLSGRKKTVPAGFRELEKANRNAFSNLLLLLGFISIITQVVFVREFISVLSGNELVVGIILSAWMLLTGWGAYHARKGNFINFSLQRAINMLGAISIFPIILVTLLYLLKNLLFPPGTMVNIGNSVLAAFLLLFPVCFLSGYLFTLFSTGFSVSGQSNLIGKAYSIESLGSLAAGVLFTVVFGRLFNSIQVFAIAAALIFLAGTSMIWRIEHRIYWAGLLFGILVPSSIFIFNPDQLIKKFSFPNQELVDTQSTRYGNLVITRQAGQVNVYQDNNLQFYTENLMMNEEVVHFAMVQHENPKEVLLLSGGIAGMLDEILKYKVDKITYLETNPEILRLAGEYVRALPDSGKVEIIRKDIRNFIGKTSQQYDVILINLPAPTSLGLNRFYTVEFFELIKKLCKPGTIVSTNLPSTANYAEQNALDANSSLWKTIGLFFKNQLFIPGEKNYFLASEANLYGDIAQRIALKDIPTEYANPYFLDDELIAQRSETLTLQFSEEVPVNRDFHPFMFVKQIAHWLSYFGARYHLLVIIPGILFLIFFIRTDRITAGLYTGGFTAASLEVTLLLAYQVYFGSIYLSSALFFAIFMGGLAFGSSMKYRLKFPAIRTYWMLQFGLALFAIALPFLVEFRESTYDWLLPAQALFFVLIFLLASGIGYEFMLAARLRERSYSETSGVNYSTDLMGSALGAFLAAIVLLPLLGILYTCLIVAGLNVVSGLMAMTSSHNYRSGRAV